jgi:hypothetical protein
VFKTAACFYFLNKPHSISAEARDDFFYDSILSRMTN